MPPLVVVFHDLVPFWRFTPILKNFGVVYEGYLSLLFTFKENSLPYPPLLLISIHFFNKRERCLFVYLSLYRKCVPYSPDCIDICNIFCAQDKHSLRGISSAHFLMLTIAFMPYRPVIHSARAFGPLIRGVVAVVVSSLS